MNALRFSPGFSHELVRKCKMPWNQNEPEETLATSALFKPEKIDERARERERWMFASNLTSLQSSEAADQNSRLLSFTSTWLGLSNRSLVFQSWAGMSCLGTLKEQRDFKLLVIGFRIAWEKIVTDCDLLCVTSAATEVERFLFRNFTGCAWLIKDEAKRRIMQLQSCWLMESRINWAFSVSNYPNYPIAWPVPVWFELRYDMNSHFTLKSIPGKAWLVMVVIRAI